MTMLRNPVRVHFLIPTIEQSASDEWTAKGSSGMIV